MNVEKVWGARYKLGAPYLSKNTVLWIQSDILITKFLEMLRGNFSSHVATVEVTSKFFT
jgi:hypothetical protein